MNSFDGIPNEELESRIVSSWDALNSVLESMSTNPAMQDGVRRMMTAEDLLAELHAIELRSPVAAQQILQACIAALVNTQTVRAIDAELLRRNYYRN
jgi:hypothetical protein